MARPGDAKRRPVSAGLGVAHGVREHLLLRRQPCFSCKKMASQPSALFMTCSIQTSFSGKL
jgi:hypothetical protein